MKKKLLIATLPYTSANSVLDNLSEAEFENISVLMQDMSKAKQLAALSGPLKNVNSAQLPQALHYNAVPQTVINAIQEALKKGLVLIAFTLPANAVASAKEIVQNSGAQQLEVI